MNVAQESVGESNEVRQLIVTTARALAEAEGWEAVSSRRLAERTECGQALLYQLFPSREAIVAAVAMDGFAELASVLQAVRTHDEAWAAVVAAYLDFANANPALYDAMFLLTSDLPFDERDTATPLRAAFDELRKSLAPLAAGRDVDAFTEVGWSTLHGMVMLTRGGRLRPDLQELREAVIREQLLGPYPETPW